MCVDTHVYVVYTYMSYKGPKFLISEECRSAPVPPFLTCLEAVRHAVTMPSRMAMVGRSWSCKKTWPLWCGRCLHMALYLTEDAQGTSSIAQASGFVWLQPPIRRCTVGPGFKDSELLLMRDGPHDMGMHAPIFPMVV